MSTTLAADVSRGILNPGNLLLVECRLNGRLEKRFTIDPATTLPLGVDCALPFQMSSGRHTLVLKVVNQSRSPHTYNYNGSVFASRGADTTAMSCPSGSRSMVNGDEVSCVFTLP